MENNKRSFAYLPFIFSVILIIGIFIGRIFFPATSQNGDTIYSQSGKINNVLNYISNSYVDTITNRQLVENAIPVILEELDPHSVYIPAKELEMVNEPLEGNFSGIGIQFNMQNDTIIVISTISNGPSEKVGVLSGDRIVKVNDTIVAGKKLSSNYIVSRLKGQRGTDVNVSIKRKGINKLIDFVITRDNIPLYSVDVSYKINKEIGYIKVSKFSRTTFKEFLNAIDNLHKKGMTKLILDLRGNSGGYLDAATNIADQFLNQSKLIVYTAGRMRPRRDYYASSKGVCLNDEVVVLIDEWSASASEILTGAIQDNDRGVVIGRRSFGKGLVQEQNLFKDGSAIRLTIARYYTPTGRCIQKSYANGYEDYYKDLQNRFDHGEFLNKDSILFADSLKFYTPEGNIVYGGGGIMPDIFIPMDTSETTPFLEKVRYSGLIYKFAFDFADKHREVLQSLQDYSSMDNYLISKNVYSKFVKYAQEHGIKASVNETIISKDVISNQLNAYIVRNILDNDGFYPILHRRDKTLLKAVDIMNKSSNK